MDMEKTEGRDERENRDSASRVIAEAIRQSSEAGRFIMHSELFGKLIERNLLMPGGDESGPAFETVIKKTMEENQDIHAIPDRDGTPRYYSSRFMSEAYCGILLKKEGDPLVLIAESVRENSALYPRPVSLEMFGNPPFDLTPAEVDSCIVQMAGRDEYKDIEKITTSAEGVFLYSTSYLEPGHAAMLAEWLDVGQFDHP
jgi:hypothetical protein